MSRPRVLILRAPGTNCDRETAYAFELAGAVCELVHVNRVLENPSLPDDYQILCIPGGFSYGDDLAAGRILASQVRHHLADAFHRFHQAGKLILGICNGFQVLIQTGLLLPDDNQGRPPATLTWNDSGRFEDRWVHLEVAPTPAVFLRGVQRLYLPVAHAEGKFVCPDQQTLQRLEQAGQLALRYADATAGQSHEVAARREFPGNGRWSASVPYPLNPNGSMGDVAGVCDETGRVFGLMPHPERHVDPTHHPQWTRFELPEQGEGLVIFRNAVEYFADALVAPRRSVV